MLNCFFLKEDDSVFSMREKQDHTAAVAFLKIVQQNPCKIRRIIPMHEFFSNIIGRYVSTHTHTHTHTQTDTQTHRHTVGGMCCYCLFC